MADAYRFWKGCPDLTDDELDDQAAMIEGAEEVSYQTFRRLVGAEELDRWARAHGYDVGHQRGGLRLNKDWAVGFYRSTWRGEPCAYLSWSAMEMIWRTVPADGEQR